MKTHLAPFASLRSLVCRWFVSRFIRVCGPAMAMIALLLMAGCATHKQAALSPASMPPFADSARVHLGTVGLAPDPRPAQFSFDRAKGQIDYAGDRAGTRAGNLLATTTPDPLVTAVVGVGTFALAPVTAAGGALAARKTLSPEKLSEREADLVKALTAMADQEQFQKSLRAAAADRNGSGLGRPDHSTDTVLEARIEELHLRRTGGGDTSYALEIKARMRLVRKADGTVWYDQPAVYRSGPGLFLDWTLPEVLASVAETGYRALAARMVEPLIVSPTQALLVGAGHRPGRTGGSAAEFQRVSARSRPTGPVRPSVAYSGYTLASAGTLIVLSTATVDQVTLQRPLGRQDAVTEAIRETQFLIDDLNSHPNIVVGLTASAVAIPVSLWKQSTAMMRGLSSRRLREAEEALNRAIDRTQPHQDLALQVAQYLAPRTALPVALRRSMLSAQTDEVPSRETSPATSNWPSPFQPVANASVQSRVGVALRIHVQRAALTGGEGPNPKLALCVEAQATLIRPQDGRQLHISSAKYCSQRRNFSEWAAHDALLFRKELQKCYDELSTALVEELVGRGVVPPASRAVAPLAKK